MPGFPLLFLLAAGLVGAAENEGRRSGTAAPPTSFDSGLSRLREKKSGPAAEAGKSDTADVVKPAKPAEPAASVAPSVPVATTKPVTTPEAAQTRAAAPAAVTAPSAALAAEASQGIRPREIQFVIAGLLLLVGFWIIWSQENYRSDAEELIKDNKISPDEASRRVANRKLGGNVLIIVGFFLFLYALL